jgi:hypothetical protein
MKHDKQASQNTIRRQEMEKVIIGDTEYIPRDQAQTPIDTDHVIIIATHGWIYEGYKVKDTESADVLLTRTNVVRRWTNGRGIGGLVKKEYKDEYTLDPVGQMLIPHHAVIASIAVEW